MTDVILGFLSLTSEGTNFETEHFGFISGTKS